LSDSGGVRVHHARCESGGKRVHQLLEAVKKAGAKDPENLTQKLVSASEDYAKAVRELK
jgi:chorismate mutase